MVDRSSPDSEERCPTCGRTDYEEAHVRMRCRDPWHADDHLRAKKPPPSSAVSSEPSYLSRQLHLIADRLFERRIDDGPTEAGLLRAAAAEIDRLRTSAQGAPDLERIFDRIGTRLNNALCEMKPGYDDSIVGFNEAWDIMRAVFKDEIAKASSVSSTHSNTAAEMHASGRTKAGNDIGGI